MERYFEDEGLLYTDSENIVGLHENRIKHSSSSGVRLMNKTNNRQIHHQQNAVVRPGIPSPTTTTTSLFKNNERGGVNKFNNSSQLSPTASAKLKGDSKPVITKQQPKDSNDSFISMLHAIEQRYSEFPRVVKIRVERWVSKLAYHVDNTTWIRERNMYTAALLHAVITKSFREPFNSLPPDGDLPSLPAWVRRAYNRKGTDHTVESIEAPRLSTASPHDKGPRIARRIATKSMSPSRRSRSRQRRSRRRSHSSKYSLDSEEEYSDSGEDSSTDISDNEKSQSSRRKRGTSSGRKDKRTSSGEKVGSSHFHQADFSMLCCRAKGSGKCMHGEVEDISLRIEINQLKGVIEQQKEQLQKAYSELAEQEDKHSATIQKLMDSHQSTVDELQRAHQETLTVNKELSSKLSHMKRTASKSHPQRNSEEIYQEMSEKRGRHSMCVADSSYHSTRGPPEEDGRYDNRYLRRYTGEGTHQSFVYADGSSGGGGGGGSGEAVQRQNVVGKKNAMKPPPPRTVVPLTPQPNSTSFKEDSHNKFPDNSQDLNEAEETPRLVYGNVEDSMDIHVPFPTSTINPVSFEEHGESTKVFPTSRINNDHDGDGGAVRKQYDKHLSRHQFEDDDKEDDDDDLSRVNLQDLIANISRFPIEATKFSLKDIHTFETQNDPLEILNSNQTFEESFECFEYEENSNVMQLESISKKNKFKEEERESESSQQNLMLLDNQEHNADGESSRFNDVSSLSQTISFNSLLNRVQYQLPPDNFDDTQLSIRHTSINKHTSNADDDDDDGVGMDSEAKTTNREKHDDGDDDKLNIALALANVHDETVYDATKQGSILKNSDPVKKLFVESCSMTFSSQGNDADGQAVFNEHEWTDIDGGVDTAATLDKETRDSVDDFLLYVDDFEKRMQTN